MSPIDSIGQDELKVETEMMNFLLDQFDYMPIGLFEQGEGKFTANAKEAFTGFCGLLQSKLECKILCDKDHRTRAEACTRHSFGMCHMGLVVPRSPNTVERKPHDRSRRF